MARARTRFVAATILAVAAVGLAAIAVNADETHGARGAAGSAHAATRPDTGAHDGGGHAVHWGYDGAEGPEHWADLSGDNTACGAGGQQSPIDLTFAVGAKVRPPEIQWTPARAAAVVNNGHTLQVNLTDAGGLMLGDTPFALKQFHVHHLSEHTVDGAHYPLELHFVHQSETGALAVIGVFLEAGEELSALAPVWEAAPRDTGAAAPLLPIDPRAFLPRSSRQFHYAGSLTTPPCSETVTWTIFADPVEASPAQIAFFADLFPHNNRPVQARNRRFVLSTD